MRKKTATLIIASLIPLACAASAQAMPTQVNVRIEGAERTLFEGPILTEGHEVEASSDTHMRSCDGINVNDPENVVPGPTPTAASADAMSLIGETFDGQWYPQYEDYFITRWGPYEQNLAEGEYWGVLVNNVFTNVGGCQHELGGGDEVMWVYNAFDSRPSLALYAAGSTSGARPLTALAQRGKPFEVEVRDYSDDSEDAPPAQPERTGSVPYEGAEVSPVEVDAKGFERPETANPATVTTDAQGEASIAFTTPGWHRIKATHLDAEGHEDAIRSNRLDVCVPPEGELECGRPPFEDEPRTPAYLEPEHGETGGGEEPPVKHENPSPAPGTGGQAGTASGVAGFTARTAAGTVRVQSARFDGLGAAHGLIGVSWRLIDGGSGVASWTISSRTLGQKGAKYVMRASGTAATSALVKLPGGRVYELELTVTDRLGHSTTAAIGKVLVPQDERWSALRYAGQWRHVALAGAWHGGVSQAAAGSQVSANLGAGSPVFELRRTSHEARVELLAGVHRKVLVLAGTSVGSLALLKVAERPRAGAVSLRVLSGTVDLDGVAVEP